MVVLTSDNINSSSTQVTLCYKLIMLIMFKYNFLKSITIKYFTFEEGRARDSSMELVNADCNYCEGYGDLNNLRGA